MTCLNQLNPLAGFVSMHTPFCSYSHRDGELRIDVSAEFHLLLGVSREHPHGTSCMNVCARHRDYSRDRNRNEHKRALDDDTGEPLAGSGLVITDHPIIDPHGLIKPPSTISLRNSTSMARYFASDKPSTITTAPQGENSVPKATTKATVKTAKAKTNGRGRPTQAVPVDSKDPDIRTLAAKQDESNERLCAGTTVKLFKRISKATKKKPVVHKTLNLYDKRLARELARLELVTKENLDNVGLAYYAG